MAIFSNVVERRLAFFAPSFLRRGVYKHQAFSAVKTPFDAVPSVEKVGKIRGIVCGGVDSRVLHPTAWPGAYLVGRHDLASISVWTDLDGKGKIPFQIETSHDRTRYYT